MLSMIPEWPVFSSIIWVLRGSPGIVIVSWEREAKIRFHYLWTDPRAFCTCSCPLPQVPSDLTRDCGCVPPYNRTECNPTWGPLAAWSSALSPPRPRRPTQVTFRMIFNSLPQMAWPLSRILAVCVIILLLEKILYMASFLIIHTSEATGSTGSCSPSGRHACTEAGPAVEVCSLLGPLGVGSLLCHPGHRTCVYWIWSKSWRVQPGFVSLVVGEVIIHDTPRMPQTQECPRIQKFTDKNLVQCMSFMEASNIFSPTVYFGFINMLSVHLINQIDEQVILFDKHVVIDVGTHVMFWGWSNIAENFRQCNKVQESKPNPGGKLEIYTVVNPMSVWTAS